MPVGKLKPEGIDVSDVQPLQQLVRKLVPTVVMPVGKLKVPIEVSDVQPYQQL